MKALFAILLTGSMVLLAQQPPANQKGGGGRRGRPQDTEVWEPEPKVVTPGAEPGAPPSDAIILFDGKNLDEWVQTRDKSPAKWFVKNGLMVVNKERGAGNIETKRTFKNYQLHIEWKIPENVTGKDQERGDQQQQNYVSGCPESALRQEQEGRRCHIRNSEEHHDLQRIEIGKKRKAGDHAANGGAGRLQQIHGAD